MKQTQRMSNEWFIIESKKERMAKMVSEINKIQLIEVITIPETYEEIKKLNNFFINYTKDQVFDQVRGGLTYIIKTVNEINQDIHRYLTRDAETMTAETMPAITSAIDKLRSLTIISFLEDNAPFLNRSNNAGNFLAYLWEFFANADGIIERLYKTRLIKVTEYKKIGFNERHNWSIFTDASNLTKETISTINELQTNRFEMFEKAELGIK